MNTLDRLAELLAKADLGALHYVDAGTMIFEDAKSCTRPAFDVRGWGWLKELADGHAIQDARGELLAAALNALPALLEIARGAQYLDLGAASERLHPLLDKLTKVKT